MWVNQYPILQDIERLYHLGIDIGGTFTDFVFRNEATGEEVIHKLPSTRDDPSRAGLAGIQHLCSQAGISVDQISRVLHGTTVATNIMLERNGAKVGLITTEGFRDILHIARKKRPLNFSNYQDIPWQSSPLVERHLRLTVPERIVPPDGAVEVALDEKAVRKALSELAEQKVDAVAVCFLFSFLNPEHELAVRRIAAEVLPDTFVTCSHEVTPLHREYERFSTTALNAYVGPATARYLQRFDDAIAEGGVGGGLRLMTSAGGLVSSKAAKQKPVSLLFSGPVGALIKGMDIGRAAGKPDVITLDVGGTSADIGVAPNGRLMHRHILDTRIGDYDAMMPMVDLTTIGAGGGSIASVDEAGMFTVGPRSAGASPGPACFGFGGTEATVTDALVATGWYRTETFARSGNEIDRKLAGQAILQNVAEPLGISLPEAALGIYQIASRNMADAIRLGSITKGYDTRDFSLIAFGGAGASFTAEIARELSIAQVIVPPHPGVGAAAGLLATDIRYEQMSSLWNDLAVLPSTELREKAASLAEQASAELSEDGFAAADTEIVYRLDCRYVGQGYELTIDVPGNFDADDWRDTVAENFHAAHERQYLRRFSDKQIQVINIRVIGIGHVPIPQSLPTLASGSDKPVAEQTCMFASDEGWGSFPTPFYDRHSLKPGTVIEGPVILEQIDTTTIVPPGFTMLVDELGNVVIKSGKPDA